MSQNRKLTLIGVVILNMVSACALSPVAPELRPDTWIVTNARVIDGTGAPAFYGAVRVSDGVVLELGAW